MKRVISKKFEKLTMPCQTPMIPATSPEFNQRDHCGIDENTMEYISPDRSFDSDILPASPPSTNIYKNNIKMGIPEGKQNNDMVIKQQDTPLGDNENHQ